MFGTCKNIPFLSKALDTAIYTFDDRGVRVVVEPRSHEGIDGQLPPIEDEDQLDDEKERESAPSDQAAEPRRWRLSVRSAIGGGVAVLFIIAWILKLLELSWKLAVYLAGKVHAPSLVGYVMLAAAVYVASLAWRISLGKHFRRRALRFQLWGYASREWCPSCGYTLREVVPQLDGCRACSECGAAWNVERWRSDLVPLRPPAILAASEPSHAKNPKKPGPAITRPLITTSMNAHVPFGTWMEPGAAWDELAAHLPRVFRLGLRRKWTILGLILLSVLGGAAVFSIVLFVTIPGIPLVVLLLPLAAVLACSCGLVRSREINAATRKMALKWIQAGQCPCCLAPLRITPVWRYNDRLCDTCGCTWKDPADPAPLPDAA